jgi:hypothetical protein
MAARPGVIGQGHGPEVATERSAERLVNVQQPSLGVMHSPALPALARVSR